MVLRILKSEGGQTAVEYLLLIVVAISLGLLFHKKMDEYVLKNPNSFIGTSLRNFSNSINTDSSGRFRYYQLPTSRRR